MRIAYFVNEFPSISQTFVLNQITGMIDRGHDVDIYASKRTDVGKLHSQISEYRLLEKTQFLADMPRSRWERLRTALLLVIHKGLWKRPLLLLRSLSLSRSLRELMSLQFLYRILAVFGRGDYDIIHCQFGTIGPRALDLRSMRVVSGKIVTSFRGFDITREKRYGRSFYRDLFEHGELFLPVSQNLRRKLLDAGCPQDRVHVLHSGIDCSRFALTDRAFTPGDRINVLTIGRFVEKKGIHLALTAFGAARNAGLDLHYTIVGDGPLRISIEEQIAADELADYVTLAGWRTHDEIVDLMQRSHILMAPSVTAADGDQEGIPNVVKEAMLIGLLVLSTIHGGIPELVENGVTGILVPERDTGALTEGLLYLSAHPESWSAMRSEARKKVEAEFDVNVVNADLERLYHSLG